MSRLTILLVGLAAYPVLHGQEFDSHVVHKEMALMRDGVKLSTEIYLPAKDGVAVDGKYPVLLSRTPYNKAGLKADASYLAQRGYVVLTQDCRGRFESEGEFYPFINEGKDGYDAIEWAAAQSWSDGRVGTFGASYLAWDQYHAAMYKPPHLSAMFAIVGGADFYHEYAHPGGATNLGWPIWIARSALTSPHASRNPEAAVRLSETLKAPGDWLRLSPKERLAAFEGFPLHRKFYEDLYAHGAKDSYWKQRGFYTSGFHKEMKDVPMLFLTGWYDYFSKGALDNFSALSEIQKTPKQLVVGPWPHGTGGSDCGDVSFGPEAGVNVRALIGEWFDHQMKGRELKFTGRDRVRIFRMGGGSGERTATGRREHGGEWLGTSAWPHPEAVPKRLHLSGDRTGQDRKLLRSGSATASQASFVFDPSNPVPTIGGRYGMGALNPWCAQDQVCSPKFFGCENALPLKDRPDVLSFSTDALNDPVDVTGQVHARLWVSSDARDTDFTAKLVDVYPDGYALIVADGQIRMRYRKSFEKPEVMKPKEVYNVAIDLGSVSNLFAKGHRIRLDISSSNFPQIEPNSNTGEPIGQWTKKVKARNTVHFDEVRDSHVELPVVPAAR